MKYVIMAAFALFSVSIASAQATHKSSTKTTKTTKSSTHTKSAKKATVSVDSLNQRKEYNWKNGQEATPTGHEATGVNGGYAALGKDSTKQKPAKAKPHQ